MRLSDPRATASGSPEATSFIAEVRRETIGKILQLCPPFAGLPLAELNAMAAITVMRFLDKGEALFFEGATATGFYVLHQGSVKIYRVNPHGNEQVIHVVQPTESFGEEDLITESGHLADARAVERSQVLLVQRAGFLELLRRRPEMSLCVLRSMGEHVSQLVELLDDLSLKDVKTRLANWLLQHSPDPQSRTPQRIQLHSTKRMLASQLGTTSETFSRTLRIFANQQFISVGRKTVTLLSAFRLSETILQNGGAFPSKPPSVWAGAPAQEPGENFFNQPSFCPGFVNHLAAWPAAQPLVRRLSRLPAAPCSGLNKKRPTLGN